MTYFKPQQEGIEPRNNAIPTIASNDRIAATASPAEQAKELLGLHEGIGQINFEIAKEVALDCAQDILEHWLPDGEAKGRQFVACNPTRDDANPGSFSINIETGIWKDFSTDDGGGDLISLVAYLEGSRQSDAALKMLEFVAGLETHAVNAIGQHSAKRKDKIKATEYTTILPIPESAMSRRPLFLGTVLGEPTSTWEYRNEQGQPICYVNRFDKPDGKQFLPLTYCRDSSGFTVWKNRAPDVPRPAYGLDRLAARPDAPVIFAEGEKAADAAQRLFPNHVAVTTMNGARSPEKTNFSPFAGRKIYIAPDNDDAGLAYKDKLIELLGKVGAQIVGVMRMDRLARGNVALPAGYDLADAETDGWTTESLSGLGEDLWESATLATDMPSTPALEPNSAPDTGSGKSQAPKKTPPLMLTRKFAVACFDGGIAFSQNQFRAYRNGYWPVLDTKVEVEREILSFLGDQATPSGIGTIMSLLATDKAVLPIKFEEPKSLICLRNGTLNPITGELLPHTPDNFLTNKLDIDWNAEASCPLWLQTLDEIFRPDEDKVEKIRLLQEFMGYCLVPMTHMHKFLWLIGGGGNGKSLVLAVLTALVGQENISFAQVERLQEKFVRAELCGKLINISSEMSARATIADGYLKQIVAGEVIEAERKHQPSFSFKAYARMIGATNELPRLLDHSDGFFRRALILPFNRKFKEEEQDKNREGKLKSELPGILNWAIIGLQGLLARGRFDVPKSSIEAISAYRVSSDPVRQFVEEFLERSEDRKTFITPLKLHEHYQQWCNGYKYVPMAVNKFTERLKSLDFEQIRPGGIRLWKVRYTEPAEYNWNFDLPAAPSTSATSGKYTL